MKRSSFYYLAAVGILVASSGKVGAATVAWTNWTAATASSGTTPGSATGTLLFGSTPVTVNYTGELDSNSETNGTGTDYITPLATYISSTVSNAPPSGDLITVTGGTSFTDTVSFSSPVQNFLMDFVSLGSPSVTVTYQFNTNTPISILSTGTGWWGGSVNLATGLSGGFDTITGQESDGVVQFTGSFSSISWSVPPPGEYWDGWSFGAVSQAVPEPALATLLPLAAIGLLGRRRGGVANPLPMQP